MVQFASVAVLLGVLVGMWFSGRGFPGVPGLEELQKSGQRCGVRNGAQSMGYSLLV